MKGRILVIDDEPEIRRNLAVGLTQEDYSVVTCPDGISAIHELDRAITNNTGFNYLITDIFMPDIDGLKILKVIKTSFPDLPVLVITAFGDERLKLTALSELNTGYLDKPFDIPSLIAAIEDLTPAERDASPLADMDQPSVVRESVSAYLTLRITDEAHSMDIFMKLHEMDGVVQCDAVHGDVDIIILAQASSEKGIVDFTEKIRAIDGLDIVSLSNVEKPKIDRDVNDFVDVYRQVVKHKEIETSYNKKGTNSYFILDIDKTQIQKIFTTVFFIDEFLFCDVIDDGTRMVGMVTGQTSFGHSSRIIDKLKQIDGVLRIREAKIINLVDN